MHTALYRKKRPASFAEIIGQHAIVTTLQNQLQNDSISHAYLFCGTRGTGKTTTARILARAVNCPSLTESAEPCNVCETCTDILAERNLNVIEIDAASNNGVDNIRDLREEVKYPPTSGTYKVYIIDEAHMLTTAAFNALLKTLEEPPAHVIFILATTEPQKIPATILSRCQRYDFKRIARRDLVNTLAAYMQSEDKAAEIPALEYIAAAADGAFRDALSILDQYLSLHPNEPITLKNVQSLLGAADQSTITAYTTALVNKDTDQALTLIDQASKEGRDLTRFITDTITHLRNLLITSQTKNPQEIIDQAQETIDQYRQQANTIDPMTLITFIQEFSELQNQLRYLPSERLALEVYTIKNCHISPTPQAAPTVSVASTSATPPPPPPLPPPPTPTPDWQSFCAAQSLLLKPMLSLCTATQTNTDLTILCPNNATLQFLTQHKPSITAEYAKFFNQPTPPNIVFQVNAGYNDTEHNKDFKQNIQTQINMQVEFE